MHTPGKRVFPIWELKWLEVLSAHRLIVVLKELPGSEERITSAVYTGGAHPLGEVMQVTYVAHCVSE